jgi:hypothetical protein
VLSERFTACKSASGDVGTLDSWVISKGNCDSTEREQEVAFACFALMMEDLSKLQKCENVRRARTPMETSVFLALSSRKLSSGISGQSWVPSVTIPHSKVGCISKRNS